MNVIPFNVPGLPEPQALAGTFVIRPVSLDASATAAGPMLSLRTAPSQGAALADGVLSIFPDQDMIAYLFPLQVRSGHKDPSPGLLVHSVSAAGVCTLFSMRYDPLNGNPVLTVAILSDEYLPKMLTTAEGATIADVSGIEDRLEFTQTFTANALGAVQRISNDLAHAPKERGNAIFGLQDDIGDISDICSFYLSRGLALSAPSGGGRPQMSADPIWSLLWHPVSAMAIIGFSVVYILTRTSASFRSANGNIRVDYNLNANRPPRNPPPHRN